MTQTPTPDPGAARPWNALSIVAFVLAFFVPVGAIVCGHIALVQLRTSGEQGRGFALAGTILGYVFSGVVVLVVILWLLFALVLFGSAAQLHSYSNLSPGT